MKDDKMFGVNGCALAMERLGKKGFGQPCLIIFISEEEVLQKNRKK